MQPLDRFVRSSGCLAYSRSSRDFLGFFSAPATRSSSDARDLPSRRRRMAVRVADWSGSRPWWLLSWVRASSALLSSSRSVGLRWSSGGSGMAVGLLQLAGDQLGDRAALALDEGDVAEQRLSLEPLDQGRRPGVRIDIGVVDLGGVVAQEQL